MFTEGELFDELHGQALQLFAMLREQGKLPSSALAGGEKLDKTLSDLKQERQPGQPVGGIVIVAAPELFDPAGRLVSRYFASICESHPDM